MKKLLLNISALLLSLLIFTSATILVTYAQDSSSVPKTTGEKLLEKSKPNKNIVSKDLYLKTYKSIVVDPEKKVRGAVSQKYGMSDSDVHNMVRNGSLEPLIKRPGADLQVTLASQYEKVFTDFQDTLAIERMRSDLEEAVKPSEIYADGDTSNSDFDLLYDLSVIELILFNKASISDFGGKFDSPAFELVDEDDEAFIDALFDAGEDEIPDSFVDEGIEPLACFYDDSLEGALDRFESSLEDEQDNVDDNVTEIDGFPAATPDEWANNPFCPDNAFFCIDIKFDSKSSSLYKKTDNCVACHVEHINKELDKMLTKPLSPNKLSGNIFEAPKCKTAFSNMPANMNVFLKAVPPPQPQNQDVYFNTSIDDEWRKFNERHNPFWYEKTDEAVQKELTSTQQTLEDRSANRALQNAAPSPTLNDVNTRTQNMINSVNNSTTQSAVRKDNESKLEVKNQQYQLIINEMDTMNKYFMAIKKTLEEMKKPCEATASKKTCT